MKRLTHAVLLLLILLSCPLWAQQTLSKVYIVPGNVSLKYGASHQFKVVGLDATGAEIPITDPIRWTTFSGTGQITPDGFYTATNVSGSRLPRAIQVTVGRFLAFASVDILDNKPVNTMVAERSWGTPGPSQIHGACGITSFGGFIYIADTNNHRIQKLTPNGDLATQWGNYGTGNGEFKFPNDIKFGPNGYLYVADTDNHRIQVFDSNGFYIRQFGTYGSQPRQFSYPADVAVAGDGTTYVADTNNHRIQKFDPTGAFVSSWGTEGSGDGQFEYPVSIAVFNTAVYVVDLYNYRVQKFDQNGRFLTKWGSEGTGPGQFSNPQGINTTANGYLLVSDGTHVENFDSNGNPVAVYGQPGTCDGGFLNAADAIEASGLGIVVVDSQLDRVTTFTWQGVYKSKWGSVAGAKGEFMSPQGVAVDVLGYVYASDTVNGRVQKFDKFGQFINQFGTYGSGPGALDWPTALAVDTHSNTYVIDGQRIVKFDGQGQYVRQWGSYGSGSGQFKDPRGITTDGLGNVYVADTGNDRIQKFGPSGNFITMWGTTGTNPGPFFNGPVSVAVDPTGSIYVLDEGNLRFQKYSSSGTFILEYRIPIAPNSQLSALTVNIFGNVYVTDAANGTVQVFYPTSTTTYQAGPIWGGSGGYTSFLLKNPTGIAASRWGHLFVADTGNNRIKKLAAYYDQITIEPVDVSMLYGSRQGFTALGYIGYEPGMPLEGPVKWIFQGKPLVDDTLVAGGTPITTSVQATYESRSFYGSVRVQMPVPENGYIVEKRWGNKSQSTIESISISDDDSLYTLSKYASFAVKQYDKNGKLLDVWGVLSKSAPTEATFYNTTELRLDSHGYVYVLNDANCTVTKLDRFGNFLKTWGSRGTADGQMNNPQSMALDSQDNIYICDTGNYRIQKFTSNGVFLKKWGSSGSGIGQFMGPWGIAIGPQNTVYVCETGGRVQKFDSEGNYITQWGSMGTGDGQFRNPKGIAVDKIGNVFVADTSNNRVQKFDSNGNFITKWGTMGSMDGQFNQPTCIAVDSKGAVYVTDSTVSRIQKFIQCSYTSNDLKKMSVGTPVSLIGQGVTAGSREMINGFYAESRDRSSGILVTGVSADRNKQVLVRGTVQKVAGECAISADQVTVMGQSSISPLGMNISQLGGGSFGHQEGVWGWRSVKMPDGKFQKQWMELSGLNNIGLLVKVWGKAGSFDPAAGVLLVDDNMGNQIKCILPSGAEPPVQGVTVSLTGISSCEYNDQGNLIPVLKLRDVNDLLQLTQ